MFLLIVAATLVLLFTTVLTIAGVGAAFIIIPTFYWLGIPLKEAMAVALLLNTFSMAFASANYIRRKLVVFQTAIPIIVLAIIFSPLGAYSTKFFSEKLLLGLFIAFLVFAGSMMLFYRPKQKVSSESTKKELVSGIATGTFAGYLGGLLGVGGGNFIVPALVWLGFDPKKASATTAFIVIFSSLSGFFWPCHNGPCEYDPPFVLCHWFNCWSLDRFLAYDREVAKPTRQNGHWNSSLRNCHQNGIGSHFLISKMGREHNLP